MKLIPTKNKWSQPTPLSTLRNIGALGLGKEEATQLCQLLADHSREGVIFLDTSGAISMSNATASTLLGGSKASLGQPLEELLYPMGPDGQITQAEHGLFYRISCGETCTVSLVSDKIASANAPDLYLIHMRGMNSNGLAGVAWLRRLNSPRDAQLRNGGLDSLTGYPGRQSFENALSQSLEQARTGSVSGLLYLDIFQFKVINETCGNEAGDELLKQLSTLLVRCLRGKDMLARLGSDEFGVLLSECSLSGAQQMATRMLKTIEAYRFRWAGRELTVGVSIGVVSVNREGESANQLLAAANASCNGAKSSGRNRINVYHGDAKAKARKAKMEWLVRIQQAIEEDRFELYHQPVVSTMEVDRQHHSEVLLRMRDEQGKLVSPIQFIPAAEQFGLMEELDKLVIKKLLKIMQETDGHPQFGYAVNVSGGSLGDSKYCDYVCRELDTTGVDASLLHFEITETVAITSRRAALNFMHELGARGCKFYLDDFGRGQSSLAYLRDLPVHFLKIDGLFVRNMLTEPKDNAVVSTINHLAHVMGLQTVAEYVESEELLEALKEMGVDFVQGYQIAKPSKLEP